MELEFAVCGLLEPLKNNKSPKEDAKGTRKNSAASRPTARQLSRGLLVEKSVFLTGHVLQTASMFLQNWLIRWFQVIADAFTVPPQNRVTGASTQWRNWSKIRRRRRTRYRRTFLSVAHTKCPSGNYGVLVYLNINREFDLRRIWCKS